MKKFLLLVLVSFPLMAADEFTNLYDCHTPHVADTGYQVVVETGGFAGITQVTLRATTFMGSKLLGKYIVSESEVDGNTVFQGKDMRLVVGPEEANQVHAASFTALGNNGRTYQGNLECVSSSRE